MPVLTRASWVAARASVDAAATAQVNFSVLIMAPVASMLVVWAASSVAAASVRAVPALPLACSYLPPVYLAVFKNDLADVSILKLASISATAGAVAEVKVAVLPVYAEASVMVF